jgi:hypothetical protein
MSSVGVMIGDGKGVGVGVGGNQIIVGVMVAEGGDSVAVGDGMNVGAPVHAQHRIPSRQ